MPRNTIDEVLQELFYTGSGQPTNGGTNPEEVKQALYQDLLKLAKEYAKPVPADDEWHKAKYEKAIPVEALKQYFGKER